MRVAVLGCGPSGLAAAHAAALAGASVRIISASRTPSTLYGAQYLHEPLPRVSLAQPVRLSYRLLGEAADYRAKVYGSQYFGSVSPEDLEEGHDAWDLREAYGRLWSLYSDRIEEHKVQPNDVPSIRSAHDLTISTIPAHLLCFGLNVEKLDKRDHMFDAAEVWAAGEAPEIGIKLPYTCPENTVVCNGDDAPTWYRMSNIFGRMTVEWPGNMTKPPVSTVARVQKPISTTCDCWIGKDYIRVGRYGAWKKGVLVHDVFNEVYQLLSGGSL